MNQQSKKDLETRKELRIEYAQNGYIVHNVNRFDDDSDPRIFTDLDSVLKHIKDHYAQLAEDIKIAKLTE